MNNIGDRLNVSAVEPIVEDAGLVRSKLEVARSHQRGKVEKGSPFDSFH